MAKIEPQVEELKKQEASEMEALRAEITALTNMVKGTADGNKLASYQNKNKKKQNLMFRMSYIQDDPQSDKKYVLNYRIKKDEARSSLANFSDPNSQIYEVLLVGETKPERMNINQFNFNVKKTDPIESIRITTDDDGIKLVTLPVNGTEVEFDSRYLN